MKRTVRILCLITFISLLAATTVMASQDVPAVTALPAEESSAATRANEKPILLAQNANYIACYKEVDMKNVLFRWCPTGSPWTATNDSRTLCYATSEDCAAAEMPQSWCIKCTGKE